MVASDFTLEFLYRCVGFLFLSKGGAKWEVKLCCLQTRGQHNDDKAYFSLTLLHEGSLSLYKDLEFGAVR